MKSRLKLVTPCTVNRTVTPKRPPNADLRTRKYLTEAEVERLLRATFDWGPTFLANAAYKADRLRKGEYRIGSCSHEDTNASDHASGRHAGGLGKGRCHFRFQG
jgi:hypothetical protein